MTTTLITGANKGLGREAANRLLQQGHEVWIAARDIELGEKAASDLGARFVQLDVTDQRSVDAAVRIIRDAGTGLDVLINNAAIYGTSAAVADVTADDIEEVLRTNVVGLVRVTQAFLPLLRESNAPVIVNVASGLGSVEVSNTPGTAEYGNNNITYAPSKSAVVMVTTQYARALPHFRVNVIDPGHTATDMNNHQGHQSVSEGTDAIVAMATITADGPTGTFTNRHGRVPW